MVPMVTKPYTNNIYKGEVNQSSTTNNPTSVSYDFPYEPETFDISEADFGASTLGDSGYKGSLDYHTATRNTRVLNHSGPIKNGVEKPEVKIPEPGTPYENVKPGFPNFHCQEPNGVQADIEKTVQIAKLNTDKFPIQDELSPSAEPQKTSFPQNGFSALAENNKPQNGFDTDVPVYQTQLSNIPSFSSMTSSGSDPDKYPIQCNTPQTPKDNPMLNPFETQLSFSNGSASSSQHSDEVVANIATSSQNGIENVMQSDIPKLENLKSDLEKNTSVVSIAQETAGQPTIGSYSLPASLHVTGVNTNSANYSNSLPMELEETVTVCDNSENITGMTGIVHSHWQASVNSSVPSNSQAEVRTTLTDTAVPGYQQFDSKQPSIMNSKSDSHISFSEQTCDSMSSVDSNAGNQNVSDTTVNPKSEYVNAAPNANVIGFSSQGEDMDVKSASVVGFGHVVEDTHMDESDLNAYLDDSSDQAALKNLHQVNIGEVQLSAKATQMSAVVKPAFETQEGLEDRSISVSDKGQVVSQVVGDHLCNIPNPKESVAIPELSKLEPGLDVSVEPVVNMVEDTSDLEVMKVLTDTAVHNSEVAANSQPVITDLNKATSPNGALSIDSGCASMPDNVTELTEGGATVETVNDASKMVDTGARPKDVNSMVHQPTDLMELSNEDISIKQPALTGQTFNPTEQMSVANGIQTLGIQSEQVEKVVEQGVVSEMTESRQLNEPKNVLPDSVENLGGIVNMADVSAGDQTQVEMRHPEGKNGNGDNSGRPRSWSPADSGQPAVPKQKRPNSLNLPPPPTIDPVDKEDMEDENSPEAALDSEQIDNQENQPVLEGRLKMKFPSNLVNFVCLSICSFRKKQ